MYWSFISMMPRRIAWRLYGQRYRVQNVMFVTNTPSMVLFTRELLQKAPCFGLAISRHSSCSCCKTFACFVEPP